jgi:hypothetical protein
MKHRPTFFLISGSLVFSAGAREVAGIGANTLQSTPDVSRHPGLSDRLQHGFHAQEKVKPSPEIVITDNRGYNPVDSGRLSLRWLKPLKKGRVRWII